MKPPLVPSDRSRRGGGGGEERPGPRLEQKGLPESRLRRSPHLTTYNYITIYIYIYTHIIHIIYIYIYIYTCTYIYIYTYTDTYTVSLVEAHVVSLPAPDLPGRLGLPTLRHWRRGSLSASICTRMVWFVSCYCLLRYMFGMPGPGHCFLP